MSESCESYTHIHVLLDRTGSMQAIRDDTIGGFNTFLDEQKAVPGEATFSLVQFDSQNPYESIHNFSPINDVPALTRETFVPRAMTPLLDAIGRTIIDVYSRIILLENPPERVVIVVITDGQENASREFRKDQIAKMIKDRQDADDWQFVFLSADLDSIGDAMSYGFAAGATMAFDSNQAGVKNVYASVSRSVGGYRAGGQSVSFTDEDRNRQRADRKRRK